MFEERERLEGFSAIAKILDAFILFVIVWIAHACAGCNTDSRIIDISRDIEEIKEEMKKDRRQL